MRVDWIDCRRTDKRRGGWSERERGDEDGREVELVEGRRRTTKLQVAGRGCCWKGGGRSGASGPSVGDGSRDFS